MDAQIKKSIEEIAQANDARLEALEKGNQDQLEKSVAAMEKLEKGLEETKTALARTQLADNISNDFDSSPEMQKFEKEFLRSKDNAQLEAKTVSVGDAAAGGNLVPEILLDRITDLLIDMNPWRRVATVEQFSGTDKYTYNRQSALASGGFVAETATRSNTDTPQILRHEIEAYELYANPQATLQSIEDAIVDVPMWLANEVAKIFEFYEGTAFTTGSGTNEPFGVTSRIASGSPAQPDRIDSIGLGSPAVITDDRLVDVVHYLKPQYMSNAKWMLNRTDLSTIRKLRDTTGRSLYDHDYNSEGGYRGLIKGYEVVVNDYMPGFGTGGSPLTQVGIVFGDFARGYKIVDRVGLSILRNPFKTPGWVEFYTRKRVGGDVCDGNALVAVSQNAV